MIFQHLQINMTYFNTDLLSSSVLNVEPDAEYQGEGVKFVPGDNIKGDYPELVVLRLQIFVKRHYHIQRLLKSLKMKTQCMMRIVRCLQNQLGSTGQGFL